MSDRSQLFLTLAALIIGLVIGGVAMSKTPINSFATPDADKEPVTWRDEVIATNLDIPWDLAQEPGTNRLIITERTGKIKVRETDGTIKIIGEAPVAIVSESGLTGVALHPNYESNHQLYLYYTYRANGELLNRVVRFTLTNDTLTEDKTILDNLPGGQIHNGGRLRFGPDKKLYIATGEGARPEIAQDMNSLGGKILRLNDDGSIPLDNPFLNSPIYTLGHRNPQGLDWHPLTEELYGTEHGETKHDELNHLQKGKNYGWPIVRTGISADYQYTNPTLESRNESWAPSGFAFYGVSIWGQRNTAFMAGLASKTLFKLEIVNGHAVIKERLLVNKYGRLRAVLIAKDGSVIISTSNRDGRAQAAADDDKLIKLTPIRNQH